MTDLTTRFRDILDEIGICHFYHKDGAYVEIHYNVDIPDRNEETVIVYYLFDKENHQLIAHAVLANRDLDMKNLNTVEDFCNTWHEDKYYPRIYVNKTQESLVCDWHWSGDDFSGEFIQDQIILKFLSVIQAVFVEAVAKDFYKENGEKKGVLRSKLKSLVTCLACGKTEE